MLTEVTGSPDWVNAIAASRTTLKVDRVLLLYAIELTAAKLSK
ncbi:hypothetical protein [Dendronalium phyllosphericum]|nr:hypothetical protein [Dendronalium phyllosphericum]